MSNLYSSYSGQSAIVEKLANGVEWIVRPYRDGDIPAIVTLINSADAVDKLDEGISEEELRTKFASPRSDPARQVIVVEGPMPPGMPQDALLGYGRITHSDDAEKGERIYGTPRVVVHPAARERGLEQVLARRLERSGEWRVASGECLGWVWHSPLATRHSPLATRHSPLATRHSPLATRHSPLATRHSPLECEVNLPTRALWEGLGLRETRQFWTTARSLHDPIDEPQPVDGANIRNYRRPEDNERARIAYNLSFADHWDSQRETVEEWNYWVSIPSLRADLSWLAEVRGPLRGEDEPGLIAGFCLCSVYDEENKRVGRREGWIGELGTIRGWRRKGLGRALLLHGLHSLRSEGLDTALLGVDSESLTGAQHLYESVGFRIRDRELQYERPLDEIGTRD